MNEQELVAATAFILLFVAFFILLIYVLVKIFRLPFRWLRWAARTADISVRMNFICFAVAAYLFPGPLRYIVAAGWQLISAFISYLPSRIQELLPSIRSSCAPSAAAEQCLQDLATKLWVIWNLFASSVISQLNLSNFPLMDAIALTAVWFGLAGAFGDGCAGVDPADGRGDADLVRG